MKNSKKIDFAPYIPYYTETFGKIVNTPSPSGYYTEIMPLLKELAESVGAEFSRTKKGCAVLTVKGRSEETLGLCAHADTLGAMVRGIGANGALTFTKVGGPSFPRWTANTARSSPVKGKNIRVRFFP